MWREDAATAISTAKSVVNDNTESYTLDGRRTIGEKGINIIRMSDGTTRKVLKK